MANHKKLYELIYLVNRAMAECHYGRAEKLFRQLLQEAFETGDNKIIAEVSRAFLVCRRLRTLEALEILKRIDPTQAKKRSLS